MRRYLLDTGIAGAYVNRREGVYKRARAEVLSGNRIGIGVPVLGELFAGVEGSDSRERNRRLLRLDLEDWTVWPFDERAAEEFGRISAELKRRGRPMQQIDRQIAAIAVSLGRCTVVSKDRDLFSVPGLDVEDWSVSEAAKS